MQVIFVGSGIEDHRKSYIKEIDFMELINFAYFQSLWVSGRFQIYSSDFSLYQSILVDFDLF